MEETIEAGNVQNAAELFAKLDEGIDDLENVRVISEEEMWKELDAT